MLSHDHPTIRPYLPDQDDPDDALLHVDLDEALERFQRDRARLVARLRTLAPADWDRTAEHGEYSRYSVFIMFRHVAMHDHLHAYRIEELLLKKDWADRGDPRSGGLPAPAVPDGTRSGFAAPHDRRARRKGHRSVRVLRLSHTALCAGRGA